MTLRSLALESPGMQDKNSRFPGLGLKGQNPWEKSLENSDFFFFKYKPGVSDVH